MFRLLLGVILAATMRGHQVLPALLGALLSCTTSGEQVEECAEPSTLNPVAPISCLATTEVHDFAKQHLARVLDAAGPLIVRIQFSAEARVASVCADRSNAPDAWDASARLSQQLGEIRALSPAPVCLAGTRLDLNEFGVHRAGVQEVIRMCEDQLQALSEAGTTTRSYIARQGDLCEEREQLRRGEIWLYGGGTRIPTVFAKTPTSASRHDAIRACLDPRIFGDPPPDDFEQRRNLIIQCMKNHDWAYLY